MTNSNLKNQSRRESEKEQPRSSDSELLVARDLTKTFGRFTALKSLSLTLSRGEFLTIVGRNGAGKTTFLKIVSSIIRSFTGDVILFGKNVKDADEDLRRRIGLVSHDSLLYKDLSVYDNLMFYARLYEIENREERVLEMIQKVDLEAKTSVLVRALSRGMKQRVSLARAFLHDPGILMLDEPFTGLDERASAILDSFLTQFKEAGGALLMVTHNIERGWRHADRVVVLDRGRVVYQTSVEEKTFDEFRGEYLQILNG